MAASVHEDDGSMAGKLVRIERMLEQLTETVLSDNTRQQLNLCGPLSVEQRERSEDSSNNPHCRIVGMEEAEVSNQPSLFGSP